MLPAPCGNLLTKGVNTMYKIKVNVEITEGDKEIISKKYETECDDFDYNVSQCSKEQYGSRYTSGIKINAIWQKNPDRPEVK